MQYDLESLEDKFSRLRVDHNNERYSAGKAPHKSLLLITLMILDKYGKVNLTDFKVDFYLKDTWDELWNSLEYNAPGSITQPLFYMKSEGFWNFDNAPDFQRPPGLSKFSGTLGSIHIDSNVAELMRSNRNDLINSLLAGGYFSESEITKISKKIKEIDDSFVYEKVLKEKLDKDFEMGSIDLSDIPARRDPAFRRIVLSAYDETCAICGMHVVTSSGVSVVDAAHILPFSQFRNDDCRNGMSFCKLHHWMFDHGLISLDDNYRVKISKDIEEASPDWAVGKLDHRDVDLPKDEKYYPARSALEWHRSNVFIN